LKRIVIWEAVKSLLSLVEWPLINDHSGTSSSTTLNANLNMALTTLLYTHHIQCCCGSAAATRGGRGVERNCHLVHAPMSASRAIASLPAARNRTRERERESTHSELCYLIKLNSHACIERDNRAEFAT
jgi:hypothetical protein